MNSMRNKLTQTKQVKMTKKPEKRQKPKLLS